MKKLFVLLALLILFTGCEIKDITNDDIDQIIEDTISLDAQRANKSFEGYKYYIPRGFSLKDKKGNNHILLSNGDTYYLYIDIVSYFHKIPMEITKDNELYFFRKISYNNIDGYIKVGTPEDDTYYIEVCFNYSKIEAYVKKENLERGIRDSLRILSSVTYNDIILDTLIGDKTIDYQEEVYDTYKSKRENGNFLDYIEEYDEYEKEEKPKDEDIIDTSRE